MGEAAKLERISLRTTPVRLSTFGPLEPSPGYGPAVSCGTTVHALLVVPPLVVVLSVVVVVVGEVGKHTAIERMTAGGRNGVRAVTVAGQRRSRCT
jgi:hypothetical protein